MKTSLIITDNFYNNPDETREWVLAQDFNVNGNFPGNRTEPMHSWGLESVIQKIINSAGGKITYFDDYYNTAFQYTTEKDSSWIHIDQNRMWAGVCYLTPNAPANGGTGLFKHKETGYECSPRLTDGSIDLEELKKTDKDSQDFSKWDMTTMVGNIYNRLVLYRGDMFHTSLEYFGKDKYDGRLFQTFFFNTEY